MFNGNAEEAMTFYISLFKNAEMKNIVRYGDDQPGKAGTVMTATFTLNEQSFMCIDSVADHDFTFTPAMSLFVNCETEEEIDHLYYQLSEKGKVFMKLNKYGFSEKYGWLEDRFGVSWQLFLNPAKT